jgi:hypothetical protein
MPRFTRLGAGLGSEVGFGSGVVFGDGTAAAALDPGLLALAFDTGTRPNLPAAVNGTALGTAEAVEGTFEVTAASEDSTRGSTWGGEGA